MFSTIDATTGGQRGAAHQDGDMSRPRPQIRRRTAWRLALVTAVIVVVAAGTVLASSPAAADAPRSHDAVEQRTDAGWSWPLLGTAQISRAYQAPAHEYGRGHRGVDLRSAVGRDVVAPRGGVVAFSGRVADRGILTIDHGDGYVSTLEPVDSSLPAGTPVARGDVVGTVSHGGHTAPGDLHFGVRLFGAYVNPQSLFENIPRAVLLPCCR